MTDEEVKNFAWLALELYADKLSAEQFDFCIRECPATALMFCSERLTEKQKQYCEEKTK